jgi:hypothetical protein
MKQRKCGNQIENSANICHKEALGRIEGNHQMRKQLLCAPAMLVACVAFTAVGVTAQEKITIPTGTVISARLASQLDSGEVHAGDLVTMDVLENILIKGELVIPHGALVWGTSPKQKVRAKWVVAGN